MLRIIVPASTHYDEVNNLFIYTKKQPLCLEHSLVSLAKWESRWCKPFFVKGEKSKEETIDYIRCMTLTQNVDPNVFLYAITDENVKAVSDYIDAPMTATWFAEEKSKKTGRAEVVTNELIYYWMIALQIPFECQKWHLNRLITLIKVCNVKNAPKKNMNRKELLSRNRALNEARKKSLKTNG